MRSLSVDPTDAAPIWSQVEDGVRRLVAVGALKPGTLVPSVRDLAKDLSINPATVAKAYQRLADAGVLTVRRGEGTYVSDSPPRMNRAERIEALKGAAARYASFAATLGADEAEAAERLRIAWRQIRDGARGERR